MNVHLSIARPTDCIEKLLPFYRDGLGFQVLGAFKDHEGFDGLMLGHPQAGYHLEFTNCKSHPVGKAPTQDHLLVFYIDDSAEWQRAVEQLAQFATRVPSFNPYWDRNGKTFEDADGYRVVLQNGSWPAQ